MQSKLSENIIDKFSMEFLKNQVLKNAYGNDDTIIAKRDPRVLLIWYGFYGVIPWFLHDLTLLFLLFSFVMVTTLLAKVAPLVLFLFGVGVVSQSGYLLIVSIFFGGDRSTLVALLIMSLKVAIVSLASITVFSGLDPDKLSNGLMWFGCPEQFSFSISFGYRILPILMEEFQHILLSYRLRGKTPEANTTKGKIKYVIYQVKIIMLCFYPLMLNTAKRSRTTVEALELKGYRYGISNKTVKKIRLSSMKINFGDGVFAALSFIWVMGSVIYSIK